MKNFKSAFLGAVVIQVWSMVSWMMIPWHMATMGQPSDPKALSEAVRKTIPSDGVYLLPGHQKDHVAQMKAMREGPMAFMIIRPNGAEPSMGKPMLLGFLFNFLAALAVLWLMGRMKVKNFKDRVIVGTLIPSIGASLVTLMSWNWWGAPIAFTVVGLLDTSLGWLLASLVMKPTKSS